MLLFIINHVHFDPYYLKNTLPFCDEKTALRDTIPALFTLLGRPGYRHETSEHAASLYGARHIADRMTHLVRTEVEALGPVGLSGLMKLFRSFERSKGMCKALVHADAYGCLVDIFWKLARESPGTDMDIVAFELMCTITA